jgi:uncharacterized membrane protein YjgN (DUF898 family)
MHTENSAPVPMALRDDDLPPYRIDTENLPGVIQAHALKFTGDGGVYFGVWLVNLLLMVVTLGLFTPFARRRTAKYFYSHTLVAGTPLEFTAGLRRMVIGFLLFFALYLAYQLAANTGQNRAVALFTVGGLAAAPFLWRSAMRFRLSATRWRGIRGMFTASTGEVYRASWPLLAIAACWAVVVLSLSPSVPVAVRAIAGVAALVITLLCVVRLEYNYAVLLFTRTEFGEQVGRWKPSYGDFVRIWLAAAGFFLLIVLAIALVFALVIGGSIWALASGAQPRGKEALVLIALAAMAGFFFMLLASGPARAYREARMFRLVWSNAGLSSVARFKCDLGIWRYVGLRLKNMLLSMLTFGFYRPFAITSEYRMKTESVTLHVKGGLDQLVGRIVTQQQSGVGDAIADAVGLDLVG